MKQLQLRREEIRRRKGKLQNRLPRLQQRKKRFLVRIISDSVIARDPATFRKFLYQLGFGHYTKGTYFAISRKDWCIQVASPFYETLVASNSAASTAIQNTPSVVSAATNVRSPSRSN